MIRRVRSHLGWFRPPSGDGLQARTMSHQGHSATRPCPQRAALKHVRAEPSPPRDGEHRDTQKPAENRYGPRADGDDAKEEVASHVYTGVTCVACKRAKVRCSRTTPCRRCIRLKCACQPPDQPHRRPKRIGQEAGMVTWKRPPRMPAKRSAKGGADGPPVVEEAAGGASGVMLRRLSSGGEIPADLKAEVSRVGGFLVRELWAIGLVRRSTAYIAKALAVAEQIGLGLHQILGDNHPQSTTSFGFLAGLTAANPSLASPFDAAFQRLPWELVPLPFQADILDDPDLVCALRYTHEGTVYLFASPCFEAQLATVDQLLERLRAAGPETASERAAAAGLMSPSDWERCVALALEVMLANGGGLGGNNSLQVLVTGASGQTEDVTVTIDHVFLGSATSCHRAVVRASRGSLAPPPPVIVDHSSPDSASLGTQASASFAVPQTPPMDANEGSTAVLPLLDMVSPPSSRSDASRPWRSHHTDAQDILPSGPLPGPRPILLHPEPPPPPTIGWHDCVLAGDLLADMSRTPGSQLDYLIDDALAARDPTYIRLYPEFKSGQDPSERPPL